MKGEKPSKIGYGTGFYKGKYRMEAYLAAVVRG